MTHFLWNSSALNKKKMIELQTGLMGVKLIFITLIKQKKNYHFFDAQISIFSLAY